MKKQVAIFLAIAVAMLLSFSSFAASSEVNTTSIPNADACYKTAVKTIEHYYKSVDTERSIDRQYTDGVDTDIASYLGRKMEAVEKYNITNNLKKDNYIMTHYLLSSESINAALLLTIQTEATFNYQDLPNVSSGFGCVVDVLFEESGSELVLSDLYVRDDYYDSIVRGDADSYKSLMQTESFTDITDNRISGMQDSLACEFDADFLEMRGDADDGETQERLSDPVLTRATLRSLNKNMIVSYAQNNCRSSNPSSGNSSVSYYDFSNISGNYDCTNFVSHALLSGGAKPYKISGGNGTTSAWYYTRLADRSSSWSGVNQLHTFLTDGSTAGGPKGSSKTYSHNGLISTWLPGDIIQFHNGITWRHSTVITGTYAINQTTWGALVCGRTSVGNYNFNQKVVEIYGSNSRRVITLKGYYN